MNRRRVFRALVGYGIAAFAVLQIIEPIMHGLHWPDEVLSYVVVALAAGFPVVVSLAWIFDVNAGRIERTEPAVGLHGLRLAAVLVGIGALAAAPGSLWYIAMHGRPPPAVAVALGALAAVGCALWLFFGRRKKVSFSAARAQPTPSIAVLPFADMSSGKDQEHLSDGIAEEILSALAQVPELRVIGRTSSFSFKGKSEDLRSIGQALGATHVLEGSVRRDGDHIRIAVKLLKAGDGLNLWSDSYDLELKNIFAIEDEVARSVVRALAPRLGEELRGPLARVRETDHNTASYELYLKGRYFREKFSADNLAKAKDCFRQAIDLDPSDARYHAGLADALTFLYELGSVRASDALPRARRAAETALSLDGQLPEGHTALGRILQNQFDWTNAERAYRRAIELRSEYARAHQYYALMLSWNGRFAEAQAEAARAREIEPISLHINYTLTWVFYVSRDYRAALEQGRRARELEPAHPGPHYFLGRVHLATRNFAEAAAEFRVGNLYKNQGRGMLGYALAKSGQRSLAERILKAPDEPLHASSKALIHLGLGDTESALFWLEKSFEENDLMMKTLKSDPLYDGIREQPRFQRLLERAALK